MNTLLFIISLLFVAQIVTNVIIIVKLLPDYKRNKKPKINISDIMSVASQIVGENNESA
ncbi:MAG: hypothetical protein K2K71_04315 [Eubacterium sp.]|nr:hypothetical protein [Eubacterium sp.]